MAIIEKCLNFSNINKSSYLDSSFTETVTKINVKTPPYSKKRKDVI